MADTLLIPPHPRSQVYTQPLWAHPELRQCWMREAQTASFSRACTFPRTSMAHTLLIRPRSQIYTQTLCTHMLLHPATSRDWKLTQSCGSAG